MLKFGRPPEAPCSESGDQKAEAQGAISRRVALGAVAGLAAASAHQSGAFDGWFSNVLLPKNAKGNAPEARVGETLSVTDARFGAVGDGRADDTAAFQLAHDVLREGGVIIVPAGTYLIDRISITNRRITIRLESGAQLKRGGVPTINRRAIFCVENLLQAYLTIEGGQIDLSGQGPSFIHDRSRVANQYKSHNVKGTIGIAGPSSELLFGLRSSHLRVSNVSIRNSGETGILFRNCSDTLVERCSFQNLANAGVEYSWPRAAHDGGQGAMPDGSRHRVRNCHFEDINDFALGTGNGCGVLGGGSPEGRVVESIEVSDCTFKRCIRDVHFELSSGRSVRGVQLSGGRSSDAMQGSVGLVNARGTITDWIARNPGAATIAALGPNYPDIYGAVVSGQVDGRVAIEGFSALDRRGTLSMFGRDGAIAAGSTRFTAANGNFSEADVGLPIGVVGAGPQSSAAAKDPGYVVLQTHIKSVESPTSITLTTAAVSSVSGAPYAYGGALREGIRLNDAGDVDIVNATIEGGIASGLSGEPQAAAITVARCSGQILIRECQLRAPRTTGKTPTGIRLVSPMRGRLFQCANRVSGFAESYDGVAAYDAPCSKLGS